MKLYLLAHVISLVWLAVSCIGFSLLLSPLLLHIFLKGQISRLSFACRFFGGGGGGPFSGFPFGGGGGFQEEEEQIPKGNNVYVELEVTLKDLYLGNTFTVLLISSHTVIV